MWPGLARNEVGSLKTIVQVGVTGLPRSSCQDREEYARRYREHSIFSENGMFLIRPSVFVP